MAYNLPLLPGFISTFIEKWASRRLPKPGFKVSIIRQRLYILPTRHGLTFFIILILVLTGAINYENNSAFMLTFLLASICFLSMIYCHQNINNLDIIASPAKPVYAGQSALFPLSIKTRKKQSHFSLCFESKNSTPTRCNLLQDDDEANIVIPVSTQKRGYMSLGKIKISTEFPLGLFHAWSWILLKSNCLVYPRPEYHPFFTSNSSNKPGKQSFKKSGYDDFSNIREYQKEDPPNHLAWKAIAKTGVLQTKQFHGNTSTELYLNWFDLPDNMDTEKRLSVMCYWIIEIEKRGIQYGIKLPGISIEPNHGLHHHQNCLKQLALFGL